ncbi:helix-turn-helix transcriptional regulator [Faecalibacterium sp. An58]|uniref:helix-turn-helix domain-containing protein n=1 Tax=Faecalibacterium sp. An58 TaxID=1965648 RepID=UPI0031BB564E
MIDKDMNKTDLRCKVHLSTSAIAKLGKNENVTTDVLACIYAVLDCDLSDIIELQLADNPLAKRLRGFN